MEVKRLLECKIDERKHKKDGLVGNKAGRKDQKKKKKMKYKRKRKKKKKKKKKKRKKKKCQANLAAVRAAVGLI